MTPAAEAAALASIRVQTIRRIATPLMAAISDWRYAPEGDPAERTPERDAALFADLTSAAVALTGRLADAVGVADTPSADADRWTLATSAADIVAAHFRATARMPTVSEIELLIAAAAELEGPEGRPADHDAPSSAVMTRIRILRTLSSVGAAVARFPFGRDPATLVHEICDRLVRHAADVTRLLAPDPCPVADWHALRIGVLEATTEIYVDAHYAEIDRLLDMTEAERADYVQPYAGLTPVTPIWDAFELRMSLLTAIAERLDNHVAAMGGVR